LKRYDPYCRNRERCSPSIKLVLCRKNRAGLFFTKANQVFKQVVDWKPFIMSEKDKHPETNTGPQPTQGANAGLPILSKFLSRRASLEPLDLSLFASA